ncbi:MAG: hypothetical protein FWE31_04145 [Firmicutes bacterium]|nr:hypothetical protein [Bacillota bacterium]
MIRTSLEGKVWAQHINIIDDKFLCVPLGGGGKYNLSKYIALSDTIGFKTIGADESYKFPKEDGMKIEGVSAWLRKFGAGLKSIPDENFIDYDFSQAELVLKEQRILHDFVQNLMNLQKGNEAIAEDVEVAENNSFDDLLQQLKDKMIEEWGTQNSIEDLYKRNNQIISVLDFAEDALVQNNHQLAEANLELGIAQINHKRRHQKRFTGGENEKMQGNA